MKYIFTILFLITISNAQTTMCFKSNWNDPSTIENIALNGGECMGTKSIVQMKSEGWIVNDIKISTGTSGLSFIYVLNKANQIVVPTQNNTIQTGQPIDYKKLAEGLKEQKEKDEYKDNLSHGEQYYKKTCQECHGTKGELSAKGTSEPLNSLSLDDMKERIQQYQDFELDRGLAILMRPYATLVTENDLKAIRIYLDKINKK